MVENELARTLPIPKIGLVPPSKEVSSISAPGRESDLMQAIRYWPNTEKFFLAVYHHTILAEEMRPHSTPAQGETRYRSVTSFPDPFSLLSLLANAKDQNELFTAVMVAPQLPTAVLAQQTAAIANQSHGRFNLGVGVGWNDSEYRALAMGNRIKKRGQILNQQIPALEMMLTGKTVSLEIGDDESIESMAINPPAVYDVPIWVGGLSDAALERAAMYGDGWMPLGDVGPFIEKKPKLLAMLAKNYRDTGSFGFMGRVTLGKKTIAEAEADFLAWIDAGATHVVLTTTDEQNPDPDPETHLKRVMDFMRATEWIRLPDGVSLGKTFGETLLSVPPNTLPGGDSKDLLCFKLKRDRRRLDQFLNRYHFETVPAETNIRITIPELSQSELRVTEIKSSPKRKPIWFLETCDEAQETCVIYHHDFDFLGRRGW